ncbi:MAG: hypothetical protein P4M15_08180 [Alphaproteobacteria bacterium]|nr:hypothetical protein [Alphaproteobacteria bacterium]
MDLLQAARQFSTRAHEGERLKYVPGPYYTHPKAVSERQWDVPAKVEALLHDTVESHVKNTLGKHPDPHQEERVIAEYLKYIQKYFRGKGCDISDLIPDIDILTKRTTDTDYGKYIDRIIDRAKRTGSLRALLVKLADLDDNSLPERNPRLSMQTDKDRARLARYTAAIYQIENSFPGIELRPSVKDRPRVRDLPGGGRRTLADLAAKEEVGSRGVIRRARRPGFKKPDAKPPEPHKH